MLPQFDIKQPVFFADINWNALQVQAQHREIRIQEVPKFPIVYRDLALVVPSQLKYDDVEAAVQKLKLSHLQEVRLFDVFESEKLGHGKKSMAISFTFLDKEKTLTDREIDEIMSKIMMTMEKELGAEIRR